MDKLRDGPVANIRSSAHPLVASLILKARRMHPTLPLSDSAFHLKVVFSSDPEDAHAPYGVASNDGTLLCDGLETEIEAKRVIECVNDLRAAQTENSNGKSSSRRFVPRRAKAS